MAAGQELVAEQAVVVERVVVAEAVVEAEQLGELVQQVADGQVLVPEQGQEQDRRAELLHEREQAQRVEPGQEVVEGAPRG